MKRIALCMIAVLILLVAVPAFAATSTLTGTITGNQGFVENYNFDCQPFNDGDVYYYEVYTINVTEAGKYLFHDNGPTALSVAFYTHNGFGTAAPTANCIASFYGDNSVTFPTAGLYTVVVSTVLPETTGVFSFTLTGPGTVTFVEESNACTQSLPGGSTVRPVPNGAPAYYDADPATLLPFSLPAGTWWVSETSGDFAKVWIGCDANPVWIPVNAVAP
jgi:hypothetical protein